MSAPVSVLCPTLIGREAAVVAAREAVERLAAGRGRTLLISGEAGIGKSRLVAELAALAVERSLPIVRGACLDADRALPFAPISDLLRRAVAGMPPERRAQMFDQFGADLRRLLPELSPMTAERAPADPDANRRRTMRALEAWIDQQTVERPLLTVIEDLHWSDGESLDLLLRLARRTAEQPFLLVLTFRPDEPGSELGQFLVALDRERLADELRLPPLARDEVAAMLRAMFSLNRPVNAAFAETISTLTEGNPFFVEEVVKSLVVEGGVSYDDIVRSGLPVGAIAPPRTVTEAVQQRMRHLSPAARRALEVAAVAGRQFDLEVVAAVTGDDKRALAAIARELMAAQLVVEESADRFAFRHALTRQAVYQELLARERRALHGEVVAALVRRAGGATDQVAGELAHHYHEAGNASETQWYAERAGRLAAAGYAPRAAAGFFTLAMEAAVLRGEQPSLEIRRARGLAYEAIGEIDAARADLEAALALAEKLKKPERHQMQAAISLELGQLWSARDYDEAGTYLMRASVISRNTPDLTIHVSSLNGFGNWHMNGERPLDALRKHEEALQIARKLGDEQLVAATEVYLGFAHSFAGDLDTARRSFEAALVYDRRAGRRSQVATVLAAMVLCGPTTPADTQAPVAIGYPELERGVAEAAWIAREIDQPALIVFTGIISIACFGSRGELGRALATAEDALAAAEAIGHSEWTGGAHTEAGIVLTDALALEEAVARLEQGLVIARELRSAHWTMYSAARLASALIAYGDLDRAERILGDQQHAKTPMTSTARRCCWGARAELLAERGDHKAALKIVDRLIDSAPNASAERIVVRFTLQRGELLIMLGRLGEAEHELRRAASAAAAVGTLPYVWRANAALAWLLRGQRRRDEAETVSAVARTAIETMAATLTDEVLRQQFLGRALAKLPTERPPTPLRAAKAAAGGLTAREREVAVLVGRGYTNRRIGEALSISEETAAVHVKHILAKLDVGSRAEIAAWVARQGLLTPAG